MEREAWRTGAEMGGGGGGGGGEQLLSGRWR